MFGRLKLPPTVLYIIPKRVVLRAKSLGSFRKKSLRDREVSASNFYVGFLEHCVGRRKRGGAYIVCVNAKLFSEERPHGRGTVSGIAPYRHLGGDGIACQAYANDCQRHCKVVADIPDVLLSIQQFGQVGNTVVANEL